MHRTATRAARSHASSPARGRTARAVAVGLAMLAALAGCATPEADTTNLFDASHVTADQFALAVETEGVTVIDVRTPEEFAAGHIPGAININVESDDFVGQIALLDPTASYAVYCRSGNRSRAAINIMTLAGFTSLVGLEGGVGAWTEPLVTQ